MKVKYLILGAGPAGLTIANSLLKRGETSILVLEKNQEAGGLCRSKMVDGSELDIGGGHFLDVRRPKVVDFLFEFMPEEEWSRFERDSKIYVHDTYIGHPFEANIWQFDEELQKMYLESIADAGCNKNQKMPEVFTEWIEWKLGKAISDNYMLPYNKKMYGEALDELGTYWLEKLPNVSYEETLMSCKEHKPYGTQPGHAEFYYPKKYGFGEVFRRMADNLGERIIYNEAVEVLDMNARTVNSKYEAEYIITTVPWTDIKEVNGFSAKVQDKLDKLKYTGIYIDYFSDKLDSKAQWIYYPEESLVYHRILLRHNFLDGANGYWTETNAQRREKLGLQSDFAYKNEYAYPLNTIGKNEIMQEVLNEAREKSVYGLGRWGEWQHYNMDVVIERAMNLAENI